MEIVFSQIFNYRQTGITTENLPLGTGTALANAKVVGIQMRDEGEIMRGGEIIPKNVFDACFLELHSTSKKVGEIPFRMICNATNLCGAYIFKKGMVLDVSSTRILSNKTSDKSVEIIFLLE